MRMYIGVTDLDWYQLLLERQPEEVNFWTPGPRVFKALQRNELFLFKLHHPQNAIVGGGYFVRSTILPAHLAWEAFGEDNGTRSLAQLKERIGKYRKNAAPELSPSIGCIILTDPFFFRKEEWIPAPDSFARNIVTGKGYDMDEAEGARIWQQVRERLEAKRISAEPQARYALGAAKHRLGQGAFRVLVTDAYQRRCAVTGEKTLPVLEAAHIRPYAQDGPHEVTNGLLLRSDLHTLYDEGYLTIDPDYRIAVSRRLHEDYGNGRDYYKYDGKKLMILPENQMEMPSPDQLEWHNEHVFLG